MYSRKIFHPEFGGKEKTEKQKKASACGVYTLQADVK